MSVSARQMNVYSITVLAKSWFRKRTQTFEVSAYNKSLALQQAKVMHPKAITITARFDRIVRN